MHEPEEENDEYDGVVEHELMGMQYSLFQLAECFGGPVDGAKLPVPLPKVGTIISGYDHDTSDMMHYRLEECVDEETGDSKFIYQFMECKNAPDISFDEFMEAVDAYDEEHNSDEYDEEDDEEDD